MQIRTQVLCSFLCAVWTLPFTHTGSICFVWHCASCVDEALIFELSDQQPWTTVFVLASDLNGKTSCVERSKKFWISHFTCQINILWVVLLGASFWNNWFCWTVHVKAGVTALSESVPHDTPGVSTTYTWEIVKAAVWCGVYICRSVGVHFKMMSQATGCPRLCAKRSCRCGGSRVLLSYAKLSTIFAPGGRIAPWSCSSWFCPVLSVEFHFMSIRFVLCWNLILTWRWVRN